MSHYCSSKCLLYSTSDAQPETMYRAEVDNLNKDLEDAIDALEDFHIDGEPLGETQLVPEETQQPEETHHIVQVDTQDTHAQHHPDAPVQTPQRAESSVAQFFTPGYKDTTPNPQRPDLASHAAWTAKDGARGEGLATSAAGDAQQGTAGGGQQSATGGDQHGVKQKADHEARSGMSCVCGCLGRSLGDMLPCCFLKTHLSKVCNIDV